MSWNNTKTGLIIADTANILAEVQAVFTNAFPGLSVEPSTPQGQLITFITERLTSAQSQIAYMSNIFTEGGSGAYLDNWAASFYGISRKGESPAMADLLITGARGTVVPAGFKASDGASAIFVTNESVIIDETGSVTISATAEKQNQKQVLKNTLTTVVSPVAGVERVTNPFNSTASASPETDSELHRRAVNLSKQFLTSSVFGAGLAQIGELEGVTKVGGYENVADTPVNIKGELLPAHSVNYIVQGGDLGLIGKTLLKSKNPGCAMGGNTTVQMEEQVSGQIYDVSFFRPIDAALKCAITVKIDLSNNYNYTNIVSAALQKYIASLPFGSIVYPINAVTALDGLGVKILDLKMCKDDGSAMSYEPIAFNFTDNIILPDANITVTGAE